jgi:hypothetical protein
VTPPASSVRRLHRQSTGALPSRAAFPLTTPHFRNRLVAVVCDDVHEAPAADEREQSASAGLGVRRLLLSAKAGVEAVVADTPYLGRDLSFTRVDFRDTQQPIEIEVSLSDFTVEQRGLYGDYIRFGSPATLVVGVRAIWNDAAEEVETEHHYPLHSASRLRREERKGFSLQWLPSWRDPSRMLQSAPHRA